MKLDRYDLRILEVLQKDGRLPMARVAEQIGLSPSPTWERVRKLEQSGIIRGYRGEIAVEDATQLVQVLVHICLESHRSQDFRRFEQMAMRLPNVVACWAVGGSVDYILHFVSRSIENYQQTIESVLEAEVGIRRYWSHVVTKPIKRFSGIPLGLFFTPDEEAHR